MKQPVATGVFVLALVMSLATVAAAGDERESRSALEQLNPAWSGASCRLLIPVVIKKGHDGNGWSKSPWMCLQGSGDKDEDSCFRVFVSDRAAIAGLMDGKSLRPGVRLISDGWSFEDANDAEGLQLNLRFVDAPARMSWRFTRPGHMTTKSFMSAARIRHVERSMRLDAFQISPTSEQLVAVAAPTAVPAPAPTATPAGTEVFRPEVRVLAVSVQPATTRAGAEVELVVTYEVSGVPPAAPFEVTETRQLTAGPTTLATFSERIARSAGTFTSKLGVRVPLDLEPGLYSLEATITMAGVTDRGSALFKVLSGSSGAGP